MAAANNRRFAISAPTVNPILIKELRSQMRGPRAFATLTSFLLLLSAVAYFFYHTMQQNAQWGGPIPLSVLLGGTMFLGLSFVVMFLIAFVTPALTAGTISGEREALTYEMLVATPLRPIWILTGKMTAAMTYVFLLILAAVPMMSLVYIFGGVTLTDMAKTMLVLLAMAICYGTIGIFWSSLLKRTSRATVASYLTIALLLMVPAAINLLYPALNQMNPTPPIALNLFNPFAAIASVPLSTTGSQMLVSYGGPMAIIFGLLTGLNGYWGPAPDFTQMAHPIWQWTVAIYALLSLVLALIAVVMVRPMGRARLRWWEPLLFILIVGAAGAAFVGYFGVTEISALFNVPDFNNFPRPIEPPIRMPLG